MKKGEESRQRLIECAAELFWKNGYSATGISEILKQTDLPKGSFYFYFKSKDDLATAVTEYYQKILLEQFQNSSQGNDWESFIEEIFDFLSERTNGQTFAGCPYAVMGMETALSKPAVASVFMEGLKKFEQIFSGSIVMLRIVSRSCKNSFSAHAFYLSGIFSSWTNQRRYFLFEKCKKKHD